MTEDQQAPARGRRDRAASRVHYEAEELDKRIFNKDTNRLILRNLMEEGIRDASGSRVGKTIIFARNHNHAVLLEKLFDEMYPQYGGKFCRVIDNYDPRPQDLIDEFKDSASRCLRSPSRSTCSTPASTCPRSSTSSSPSRSTPT